MSEANDSSKTPPTDRHWDFPYENCMVREDRSTGNLAVFITFYGRAENRVDISSSLYRDAMSSGILIDAATYEAGKPTSAATHLNKLPDRD